MDRVRKILYVDDEPLAQKAFRRSLVRDAFMVVTVGTASEALSLLRKIKFDAVVLDILMPGTNGFKLMTEIRRIDPALPAIVLTGLISDRALFHSIKLGCDGFLEKPYDPEDLKAQINAVLARRSMETESAAPSGGSSHETA